MLIHILVQQSLEFVGAPRIEVFIGIYPISVEELLLELTQLDIGLLLFFVALTLGILDCSGSRSVEV